MPSFFSSCHLIVIKRLRLRYSIRDRYSNRECSCLICVFKRSWRVWRASSKARWSVYEFPFWTRCMRCNQVVGSLHLRLESLSSPSSRFSFSLLLFFFRANFCTVVSSRVAEFTMRWPRLISTPAICSCKSSRNFHKVRKFVGRRGTYRARLNYSI